MKQKRKLALFTLGLFCLWPSVTAIDNAQNKDKEKQSTPQQEDNLAQNITLVLRTVQEAKELAKNTKKESVEWRKQVDKTTETANEMTKKLSDAAHKMANGMDTLKHESQEWRKESEKIRKEIAMLREEADKQGGKLIVRGTGGILLAIGALGLILKPKFSNEKWNYSLLGSIITISTLGTAFLFLL